MFTKTVGLRVLDWLHPIEQPDYVLHLLHESGIPARFPTDALRLLNAVFDDQRWFLQEELRHCLNAISQAAPVLLQDYRYQRLDEYSRRRGI